MPAKLPPGQPYSNRPPGVVPTNLSLTREAHTLLRVFAPSSKAHGHFVSRLIEQYAAKHEITRKIQEVLTAEGTMQD
jgi:hypothetical protein